MGLCQPAGLSLPRIGSWGALAAGGAGMTSQRTTHGLALRVLGACLAGVLALSGGPAQALPRGDWTRVATLPQGLPTRVRLHTADPASGRKQIRGLFVSADSASITVTLRDGRARTIANSHIRKVAVPRKLSRRYAGWIVLGVTLVATGLLSAGNADPPYPPLYVSGAGLSGLAFWRQAWRDVYRSSAGSHN